MAERELFEDSVRAWPTFKDSMLVRDGRFPEYYGNAIVQGAWEGWKACGRRRDELGGDTARLDFLDQLHRALNARYGSDYRWKLILSPHVVRIMTGQQLHGFVGDIDLNDANAGGARSCRGALDDAMNRYCRKEVPDGGG